MNWNNLIRQSHRWLSIIFTLAVIANFVSMAMAAPAAWLVYTPLPPLFLMLVTGLYMFVLPYTRRNKQASAGKVSDKQVSSES